MPNRTIEPQAPVERRDVRIVPWHALDAEKVLSALDTGEAGLTPGEAQRRLAADGPNELTAKRRRSRLAILLDQFKSPLILILLGAAAIAYAMGIAGTEVAKGAADMVLADDNFATIVAAVEEGRVISDNLRRVAEYLTATCVGNLATVAIAILLGLPLPLTAVMLLWINLVATGVFDKPLALEPGAPDRMARPPRSPQEPMITRPAFARLMLMGFGIAAGTLAVFAWELSLGESLVHAQTVAFTVNATLQAFSAFAYRSADRTFWQLPANHWLLAGAALALAIHLLAVYWPPFQLFLGTEALAPWELAVAVAEGMTLFVLAEAYKLARQLLRRRHGRIVR